MLNVLHFLAALFRSPFRSRAACEVEVLFLRQQLIVLRRSAPRRIPIRRSDKLIFVVLYRLFPSLIGAAAIFKPDTLICWHRTGFRLLWHRKSCRRAGRPPVSADVRALIRRTRRENPLWGAPRIHGELLKLGISIAQSSVARYMEPRSRPPSPTIGFKLLYAFVVLRLERRLLL